MKARSRLVPALAAAVCALMTAGVAQSRHPSATKEFMRQKLELSQRVLEGVVTGNFELVAVNARRLGAMSLEANWRAFGNAGYTRHSDEFRRLTEALARTAAERNLDGVTLAYMRVTMSCVECHKFVRGEKTAHLTPRGLVDVLLARH